MKSSHPRIVSFLPAATEIVHALGAGDLLLGRSHECDYPAGVETLPVVSRPALQLEGLTPEQIDRAVAEQLQSGQSLYQVDELLLERLAPDVVLTQDLCQVCAPSGNELSRALQELSSKPEVLWLSPQTLADVEQNIVAVGNAVGRGPEAEALVAEGRARIARVSAAVADQPQRRVAFLEWLEPLYSGGHWVPEMIQLAGGQDPLGHPGADSVRVSRDALLAARPEVVIVAPCGFGLTQATKLARELPPVPGATAYAVDANAYFARPGPRLAHGVELLAQLLHPDRFTWPHPGQPWARI